MFDFKSIYEASSVGNAIDLMKQHPNAKIIAGGSDILIKLREGKLTGCELISIQSIDEFRGISNKDDRSIRIGALESFSHIAENKIINYNIPVLGEAAIAVGGPQVRNIGTIGGNICNGVTSADTASTLLAWDAVLELVSHEGLRYIPISKFYIDAGKVDIRQGELLTSVLISKDSYLDFTGFYYKYSIRNAMDISVCNCSLNVKLSQDKKAIENVRVAYGAAGPVPVRAYSAEQTIKSRLISSELIDEFAEVVINNLNPRSSYRADREFRKHIIKEITIKCLTESLRRGGAYGTI
jgi:xanthine dehydrogenase FAD-binding subunit